MAYKTVVMDDSPKAEKMAADIEQAANEMAKDNWAFVACSLTNSAKAIHVFRTAEAKE